MACQSPSLMQPSDQLVMRRRRHRDQNGVSVPSRTCSSVHEITVQKVDTYLKQLFSDPRQKLKMIDFLHTGKLELNDKDSSNFFKKWGDIIRSGNELKITKKFR